MSKEECTEKQKAFAREYLEDFKAGPAAFRAGYSKNSSDSQGSLLLKNPKVRKEINRIIGLMLEDQREEIKAKVINLFKRIAHYDISEFLEISTEETLDYDSEGKPCQIIKQIAKIRDTGSLDTTPISSIEQNEKGSIKIRFYDKLKAAELLAKYTGLLTEKSEVDVNVTYKVIPAPEPGGNENSGNN